MKLSELMVGLSSKAGEALFDAGRIGVPASEIGELISKALAGALPAESEILFGLEQDRLQLTATSAQGEVSWILVLRNSLLIVRGLVSEPGTFQVTLETVRLSDILTVEVFVDGLLHRVAK